MGRSLEEALAYHCAPALAGLKPANLLACSPALYPAMERELGDLNRRLNPRGLYFRPLCRCDNGRLLLVYRRELLERRLREPEARDFLRQSGYPDGVEAVLDHLQQRLREAESFPHEAGVILGYPVRDVEGFLEDGGRGCKLCGYWKVYGDVDQARALFRRYTRCRERLCQLVSEGRTLTQLFCGKAARPV